MPRFEPFTESTPLPAAGDGYERAVLDLKARSDARGMKGFHLAKDVAAFANHLGGTLLIGATDTNGRVGAYEPLDEEELLAVQSAFSQAVGQRCSPRPVFDFVRKREQCGFILAVNVWPYAGGQVIGVATKCSRAHDGYGGDAYVFPIRAGVDSTYLLPEQLPMFMIPAIRRMAILLSAIPENARVHVRLGRNDGGGYEEWHFTFREVDEAQNAVHFVKEGGSGEGRVFPLDHIEAVYQDVRLGWYVNVRKYR